MAITFKLENDIDHVFQEFGAGNSASLGDMTNKNSRSGSIFGEVDEKVATGSDLGDGASSTGE